MIYYKDRIDSKVIDNIVVSFCV